MSSSRIYRRVLDDNLIQGDIIRTAYAFWKLNILLSHFSISITKQQHDPEALFLTDRARKPIPLESVLITTTREKED